MSNNHNRSNFEFSSRTGLQIATIGSLIGSGAFHWMVQSQMTSNIAVAIAFTVIFVLLPVVAAGFVFPTSPAGMLLMRIKLCTSGYAALVLAGAFVIGYDAYLMNGWWLTQDVVRTSGYVLHQVVLSIIGFHVLPGLLVSQVSTTEMIETIRQAHLVKRYKLQTNAELAILRNTTMRSVELSQRGMSNLSDRERDELARIMVGLVNGIDNTMRDITSSVKGVSTVDVGHGSLLDNPQIAGNLDVAVRYLQGSADNNESQARSNRGGDAGKPLSAPSNDGGSTSQHDRGSNRGDQRAEQQRQQAPAKWQARADQQQQEGDHRPATPQSASGDQPANGPRLLQLPIDARQGGREVGAALVTYTSEQHCINLTSTPAIQAAPPDLNDMPTLFDLVDQHATALRVA